VCGSEDKSLVAHAANFDADGLNQFAFASRKLPEYMHHRLIQCPVCDLLYADPAPTPESLLGNYREAAYDSADEAAFAADTYARLLPSIVSQISSLGAALDIGAGDGAFLEKLLAAGFSEVMGIEPSKAPIAAAKPEIRPLIREGFFCAEEFQGQSFDLITCFQTLEHFFDPMDVLRDINALLKPGGAVLLVGHNRRALPNKLLRTKSPIFDIEHLQLFSGESLGFLLEKAGFTGIKLNKIVNRYPLRYWAKLLPFPAKIKTKMLVGFDSNRFGSLAVPMPSVNVAAIGYKPA